MAELAGETQPPLTPLRPLHLSKISHAPSLIPERQHLRQLSPSPLRFPQLLYLYILSGVETLIRRLQDNFLVLDRQAPKRHASVEAVVSCIDLRSIPRVAVLFILRVMYLSSVFTSVCDAMETGNVVTELV
jgi:hypothetical protein